MRHEHDDELDRILQENWLAVPRDFPDRVMARLGQMAPPASHAPRLREAWRTKGRRWLMWASVAAGAAVGAMEVLTFMLGAWSAASAL